MRKTKLSLIAASAIVTASLFTGCGSDEDTTATLTPTTAAKTPLLTLDGNAPLIIAHRGLSGLYPEETLPAYEAAADAGADSLELDIHLTKDCVLVARYNHWLSDNTNITEVAKTNPEVAA